MKGFFIEKGRYTEKDYPFTIKPNFSTQGSIIQISRGEPDDSSGKYLCFNASTIYQEYNLSPNPVDIISFDNIFLERDIAQVMIFKGDNQE